MLPFAWTLGLVEPPRGSRERRRQRDLLGDRQGDPPGAARRSEHARDAVRRGARPRDADRRVAPRGARRVRVAARSTAASGATRSAQLDGSSRTSGSPSTARSSSSGCATIRRSTLDAVAGGSPRRPRRARRRARDADQRASDYLKQLYRSMPIRACSRERLRGARRFARDAAATFDLPRDLRPKNAYNLCACSRRDPLAARRARRRSRSRARCATSCSRSSTARSRSTTSCAEAEAMTPELEAARDASTLPQQPDVARADALLRASARRSRGAGSRGAPGPSGATRRRRRRHRWRRMTTWTRADAAAAAQSRRACSPRSRREREHLVVYLSGAHAYGFPSPDSDLDLKAIHIAPTGELVGLRRRRRTATRARVIDGVEIDYTSNELAHALAASSRATATSSSASSATLALRSSAAARRAAAVRAAVAVARVHRHYRGFATSQLRGVRREEPTAKRSSTCCAPR